MKNISVIIPAHNEASYIKKVIKAFQNQTISPKEIIVVCDACSDNTAKLAKQAGAIVLEKNHRNVSKTRNAGIKKAKSDILVIQDADALPAKNYLEEIQKAVETGITFGGAKLIPDSDKFFSKIYIGGANLMSILWGGFQGSSFFAVKKAMLKTKLYDPDAPWAEDWEIGMQLKKFGRWRLLTNTHVLYSERKKRENGYLKEYLYRFLKMTEYFFVYKTKKKLKIR